MPEKVVEIRSARDAEKIAQPLIEQYHKHLWKADVAVFGEVIRQLRLAEPVAPR